MPSKDKAKVDCKKTHGISSTEHRIDSVANSIISSLENKINQLEEILNHVDAYIYTKDRMGRYTYANQNVLALFGTSVENVVSMKTNNSLIWRYPMTWCLMIAV